MVSVPGGFESDLSGDDCDISFGTDIGKNSNSKCSTEKTNSPIRNSLPHTYKWQYTKLNSKNGNRPKFKRRQCIDFKSSEQLDDLRFAITHGNLGTTKDILSKNIFVDTILKDNWSGLMNACASGHPHIVSYLLEAKADPNFHADMYTPLMAVCAAKKSEKDLLECCTLLLKYGANVNAHERHFTTPLIFAAREGYSLIVKLLLDHGAETNKADNRGKTALAWAAANGHGPIVRMLLENGAEVNVINDMGQSAIDLAYDNGHNEIVSLLKKGHLHIDSKGKDANSLVPKVVSDFAETSKLISSRSDTKTFSKVGELDIFLSGIGLTEHLTKFTEHQLKFHDLLIMDDAELEKIGICELGARKKILDACKSVHKKEWQTSSLPNLKQSQYISCPDAVAMMANIAKHMKYLSSSVIYIRQQIQSHPGILELAQDSANIHNLLDELDDGLKNNKSLSAEMKSLKLHLEKVQGDVQYKIADLVVEKLPSGRIRRNSICTAFLITLTSACVASIVWKYPSVLDHIPVYVRFKVPFIS